MQKHNIDLPIAALQLQAGGKGGGLSAERDDDGSVRLKRFRAYSGGLIEGHWYWDKLAIDLDGIEFEKPRYPILKDHMDDWKIGHSGVPIIGEDLSLDPGDIVLLENEFADEFLKDLGAGFPFEASIYAIPGVIEEIEAGSSVMVNGYEFLGPGNVWRKCVYRESSVCVFGWDRQSHVGMSRRPSGAENNTMRLEIRTPSKRRMQMPNIFARTIGRRKMSFAEAIDDPDVIQAVAEKVAGAVDEETVKAKIVEAVSGMAEETDEKKEMSEDEDEKKELAEETDEKKEMSEETDEKKELAEDEDPEDQLSEMTEEEAVAALEGIRANFPHLLEGDAAGGSEGGVEAMSESTGDEKKAQKEMANLRRDNHALAKRILDGERKLAREKAQRIRDGFAMSLPDGARRRLAFPFEECYSAEKNRFDEQKFAEMVRADAEDLMQLVGPAMEQHAMSGGYGGGYHEVGLPIVGGDPTPDQIDADATEWAAKFAAKYGVKPSA